MLLNLESQMRYICICGCIMHVKCCIVMVALLQFSQLKLPSGSYNFIEHVPIIMLE